MAGPEFEALRRSARELLAADPERAAERIVSLLRERLEGWDWVGWYLVDPASPRELVLGPFAGAATDHRRIPFGRGICGLAAEREESIVVLDVRQEENYLSCGDAVRSELVVPVFHEGAVIGQLDVDSHRVARFGEAERDLAEELCRLYAPAVERLRRPL